MRANYADEATKTRRKGRSRAKTNASNVMRVNRLFTAARHIGLLANGVCYVRRNRDFIQAVVFLGLHMLIVWGAVLSGLWLTRLAERLDAKRRRLDLSR